MMKMGINVEFVELVCQVIMNYLMFEGLIE